jgi:hypothetical protein
LNTVIPTSPWLALAVSTAAAMLPIAASRGLRALSLATRIRRKPKAPHVVTVRFSSGVPVADMNCCAAGLALAASHSEHRLWETTGAAASISASAARVPASGQRHRIVQRSIASVSRFVAMISPTPRAEVCGNRPSKLGYSFLPLAAVIFEVLGQVQYRTLNSSESWRNLARRIYYGLAFSSLASTD